MTNMEIINAAEQARGEYREQISGMYGTTPTRPEIDASLAGFAAGWRAAVAHLKLHKVLKVTS